MNKPWFLCESVVVPLGVFDAVAGLRGSPGGENSQCRWPLGGDVRGPDFHFCDNDAAAGSVYCRSHSSMSYKPKGSGIHD